VGTIVIVDIAVFSVAGALVFSFRDPLTSYTDLSGTAPLFIAIFGSLVLFFPFQQIMGAMGRPSMQVWNDTFRSLLTLPLQVVLVLNGLGALGMGYGLVAATLLSTPIAIYIVQVRPVMPTRETLRSLWEYGRYSTPNALVGETYSRIDIIILGFLIGTVPVANYEVALKLTIPATFASGVVATALMPKISSTISQGGDFVKDVSNSLSYASILAIPILFGAIAIPEALVVTAFESQYADAAPYLIGLALFQVIATQTTIYFQTLSGMDLPDVGLKISAGTLVFNIMIGVTLAVTVGPIGVVLATVLAEGVKYILTMFSVVRRVGGITVFPRPLRMQIVAGAVMYVVVESVNHLVLVNSWLDLGLLLGVGAVVYSAVLILISPGIRVTVHSIFEDAIAHL
jgi:O-antigen/teichoic acid export membrane protein